MQEENWAEEQGIDGRVKEGKESKGEEEKIWKCMMREMQR